MRLCADKSLSEVFYSGLPPEQKRGGGRLLINVPHVLLPSHGHLEPSTRLLERAQPFPHAPPVHQLEGLDPADHGETQDGRIRRGKVRSLAEAAREAARSGRVLHGAHGRDQAVAVGRHVLAQQGQPGQAPVEEPGPAGVGGREHLREVAQLAAQECRVALPVDVRDAFLVALVRRVAIEAREEGQHLGHRAVLQHGRVGVQAVAERGLGGEERRDVEGGRLLHVH